MNYRIALLTFLSLAFLATLPSVGQENASSQLYSIHQDLVIPSKVVQYEKAAKNLSDLFRKHNIQGMSYSAANMDNFTFIYVTPVESISDYEGLNKVWAELRDKAGTKVFDEAMAMFDGTYHSHKDFFAVGREDLSYIPSTNAAETVEMNARMWEFYNVYPGMEDKMENLIKKWKALHAKHDIKHGYSVAFGTLGTDMPGFAVIQSAEKISDFYNRGEQVMESMGDEGRKLWEETLTILRSTETHVGYVRPDLSYTPSATSGGN